LTDADKNGWSDLRGRKGDKGLAGETKIVVTQPVAKNAKAPITFGMIAQGRRDKKDRVGGNG